MSEFAVVENVVHLRPIHSEADYDRTVTLINALLDVAGDDEDHPLSGLIELAADLVSATNRNTARLNLFAVASN